MDLGNFLGGGSLTIVLVIVVVGVLLFLIIPLLSKGRSLGSLAMKTGRGFSKALSQSSLERKGLASETQREARSDNLLDQGRNSVADMHNILNDATATKDFNQEKVDAFNDKLKTFDSILTEDANIYNALIKNFTADQNTIAQSVRNINTITNSILAIQNKVLNFSEELRKLNANNPYVTEIFSIVGQLRIYADKIKSFESSEIGVLEKLKQFTEQRLSLIQECKSIKDNLISALSKQPLMQQISQLESELSELDQKIIQLKNLTTTIRNLITSRTQNLEGLEQVENQASILSNQLNELVIKTDKYLNELKAKNAAPKDLAA